MVYADVDACVDAVIARVGKDIVLGTPLGLGKPNHLINAFYRRAKSDPSIRLKIFTALTLQRPSGKSLLEKRFLGPFADRVFGDYPDLDYELDRVANKLPANIEVIEFYFPAGKFKDNSYAQRNYISSNYTHVFREMMDHQVNVLAQMICEGEIHGESLYSLSCNPDVTLDIVPWAKEQHRSGRPTAVIAQINNNLPFMFGDAVVPRDTFDFVVDNPSQHYKLFGPPKMSVQDKDYMIGLYASTLIRDDGELQVGIGSLGDALAYSLKYRQEDNAAYKALLGKLQVREKFGDVIDKIGDTEPFVYGLLGATEMLVDGFMHLWKAGILKRRVYDHIGLQRMLNEGVITEEVNPEMIDNLIERRIIHDLLTAEDVSFLQRFGIFKDPSHLRFEDGEILFADGSRVKADLDFAEFRKEILDRCLGERLSNGTVVHGGFFLGPSDFYDWLKGLPEEERKLIDMQSVRKINQLYGHEEINRLHRKNARFVNTCLMMTLSGGAVSDGLEDGTVISGVGGQYNFVSMAQELPDGYSIMQLRSTKPEGGKLRSNIVWNYGNITIPRHLRDIVITEYGIANIRGRTDEDIVKALLNITDSRFQGELMQKAKEAGKLSQDYEIPEAFRNNYPSSYESVLKGMKMEGMFPPFPFGTDFTKEEQVLGKALKYLKKKSGSKAALLGMLARAATVGSIPESLKPYMERMGLVEVKGFEEKLYQRLLLLALKDTKVS